MGEFREPNDRVSVTEEEEIPAPSPSPPSTFFLLSSSAVLSKTSVSDIGPERWAKAEKATHSIIGVVQPTAVSEDRRRAVIDYVQRLIGGCLGCEVYNLYGCRVHVFIGGGMPWQVQSDKLGPTA